MNRRRYFEKLDTWPAGFVVLGDAVATYNPLYGHGMSVAAKSAARLIHYDNARATQAEVASTVDAAWTMATTQDLRFPDVVGPRRTHLGRLLGRYTGRVARTANGNPKVTAALLGVYTLSKAPTALFSLSTALTTLRAAQHPPLTEPPWTDAERTAAASERSPLN
ncbi:hypothetical protein GCM10029964_081780 [Kibdelosporangium lantanae]